jgi:glycosyltransferase involved in cell wall biosynthesis
MSQQKKNITVVIPAYKADKTLPEVLERIPDNVYDEISNIVIVEDGGTNNPLSVSNQLKQKYSKIEIIWHPTNRGYGAAQKTGFARALELGADVGVLLHADGQYAPEEMERLYQPLINEQADVVLGSRMHDPRSALKGGMPLYKLIANISLTKLENLCYGMQVSEYHSGYMLYSRKALETIPFQKLSDTFHFDGEMLLLSGKKNLRIADLPIPTHYGDEVSHLKPIEYGFDVLKIIARNFMGKYDF